MSILCAKSWCHHLSRLDRALEVNSEMEIQNDSIGWSVSSKNMDPITNVLSTSYRRFYNASSKHETSLYNYPTVRTGMTYGRCTIGMVPGTATVRTYEVLLSCLVLRVPYDCTHLELYDCTYSSTVVPTDWLSCLYDSPNGSLLISTYYSVRSIYITDHSIYYTGRTTPSPVRYVRTYGRVLHRLRVYYDCHVPC